MRVPQLFAIVLPALVELFTSPAAAAEAELVHTNPLTNVVDNAFSSFTGWRAALHLAAVATTPVIVTTGTDTAVHNALARNQGLEPYSLPGVLSGYLLPFVAGGGLMSYGLWGDSRTELAAGNAVLQAAAIAFVYQSLLKAVTGRPAPEAVVYEDNGASRLVTYDLEPEQHRGAVARRLVVARSPGPRLRRRHPRGRHHRLCRGHGVPCR